MILEALITEFWIYPVNDSGPDSSICWCWSLTVTGVEAVSATGLLMGCLPCDGPATASLTGDFPSTPVVFSYL